ncbi:g1141 [Coccomyxa viridis]|uniref:G1141 protein n=1 Tax=Coccomyxa viridis TaxID=1274662 RepID=A0ABP1FJF1_9CHLO
MMSTPLGLRTNAPCNLTGPRPFSRIARTGASQSRTVRRQRSCHITHAASDSETGTAGKAAVALGALANPIVLVSDYVLFKTGRGLPEGPGGLFGAAEGVSYLVVVGVVGWSLYTKSKTGSGLPAGPAGLLGAIEGTSFLTLLVSIAVFGLQIVQKGSLPGITG